MKAFLKQRSTSGHINKENRDSQLLYNFEKKLRAGEKPRGQREKDAFVERVNGYIQTISSQNKQHKSSTRVPKQLFQPKPKKVQKVGSRNSSRERIASLSKKLKNEREINKNLQKCIIEIQKILWERSDRLETLEQEISCEHLLSRDNYEQFEQTSEESSSKIKAAEGDLRRYANSLGLKRILHSLNNEEIEQASEYSDTKNSGSQVSFLEGQKPYIKIERPRTESQSELPSKRRK